MHTAGFIRSHGSILTPMYVGIENALDLPQASTLCNQCGVVCPVKIPLPDLMRKLREKQFERGLRPWAERMSLRLWELGAQRPRLYAMLTDIASQSFKNSRWTCAANPISLPSAAHGLPAVISLPLAGKRFAGCIESAIIIKRLKQ